MAKPLHNFVVIFIMEEFELGRNIVNLFSMMNLFH